MTRLSRNTAMSISRWSHIFTPREVCVFRSVRANPMEVYDYADSQIRSRLTDVFSPSPPFAGIIFSR